MSVPGSNEADVIRTALTWCPYPYAGGAYAALSALVGRVEQLENVEAILRDWRHGSDWQGEGSGQMPDRVAILRIEEALGLAGGSAATEPKA